MNGGVGGGSSVGPEEAASRAKEAQDEANRANQIYMQMAADRQKAFMEMWKIMQDMNTEIMRILQDVTAYRAKVAMAAAEAWDAVIRGT